MYLKKLTPRKLVVKDVGTYSHWCFVSFLVFMLSLLGYMWFKKAPSLVLDIIVFLTFVCIIVVFVHIYRRVKVIFDVDSGKIVWQTFSGKIKNSVSLKDVKSVVYSTRLETRSTKYGSTETRQYWSVGILTKNQRYIVAEGEKERDVRELAEDIVRITGLAMENRTGKEVRIITTETVDMPLVDKMRREGRIPTFPPPQEQITWEKIGKSYQICILPRDKSQIVEKYKGKIILTGASVLAGILGVNIYEWLSGKMSISLLKGELILLIPLLAIIFLYFFGQVVYDLLRCGKIRVEKEYITLSDITMWGEKREKVPVSELEDIRIDLHQHRVSFDTDKKVFYYGGSFDYIDLKVLVQVIRAALWDVCGSEEEDYSKEAS